MNTQQTSNINATTQHGCTTSLDKVLSYENDGLVARLMQKMKLDQEAALQLFADTKRFLYMVTLNPSERFGPPEIIDDAWHHFILFMHEYDQFCNTYLGKFIHHVPETSALFVRQTENFSKTIQSAIALFGQLSNNWAMRADSCVGGSCSSDCTPFGGTTNCQSLKN
jgi:hypothetical protein